MEHPTPDRIVWLLPESEELSQVATLTPPRPGVGLHVGGTADTLNQPASAPMHHAPDTVVVLAGWKTWLEASYAEPTVRAYWGVLFRFFSHCPKPLAVIDMEDIAGFLGSFPYRSAARRTYYQALRSFFRYAENRHVILVDPTAGLRVPSAVEKVPRALTTDQVWALAVAAHASAPIRGCFVLTLYYTAARLSEAQALRWTDIEGDDLRLRVTKGGKERVVPIGAGLRATLDYLRLLQPGPDLFPRSGQTLWKWVRDAGRAVGIPDAHPHLLRSTAATAMLVRGARPHAVRQMLGHASIKTTQRYWSVERGDVELAAAQL